MSILNRIFSHECCGGPVLILSLFSIGFGLLFLILAAFELGAVFVSVGLFAMGLCLYLGTSRCRGNSQRHSYI
jgi:hypothetical protein